MVEKAIQNAKSRNFKESIELAINLKDIDLSLPANRIDEEIILPHGRGKKVKVGLFGTEEMAIKAKGVADLIITPKELEELSDDKRAAKKMAKEFQFFIAEAPLMPTIGKSLGVVLAPRGKMPRPIPPGADPTGLINNLRKSVKARSRKNKTFHVLVGTKDMDSKLVAENINTVLKRIRTKLAKGDHNIGSIYIKTSMGPAEKLV